MAATVSSASSPIRRYSWPLVQLSLVLFVLLLASGSVIGVFAAFIDFQNQLDRAIPWYFVYYIAVAALAVLFVGAVLWLLAHRRLMPAFVVLGCLVLLVLWVVGLIVVSVQLWGPNGSVWSMCTLEVFQKGPGRTTLETLAWLQRRSTCQCWQLVFAMALLGSLTLLWAMVMAYQVFVDS